MIIVVFISYNFGQRNQNKNDVSLSSFEKKYKREEYSKNEKLNGNANMGNQQRNHDNNPISSPYVF